MTKAKMYEILTTEGRCNLRSGLRKDELVSIWNGLCLAREEGRNDWWTRERLEESR